VRLKFLRRLNKSIEGAFENLYVSQGFVVTHFSGSGFNNQIHQVLNSVAVARALNRTYCLPPFLRRKSDQEDSISKFTDFLEIFDSQNFEKFVLTETVELCSSLCEKSVDFIVNMSPNEISTQAYERQNVMRNMGFDTKLNELLEKKRFKDLGGLWTEWEIASDISSQLGLTKNIRCLELFQPFPAMKVIVNGNMKFLPSLLQFKSSIENTANQIAHELFNNRTYISVHWRFEHQKKGESKCRKRNLPAKGSGEACFVIFLKKQRATQRDYLNFGDCKNCEKYLQFIHLEDIGKFLNGYKISMGINDMYLASDADPSILKMVKKYVDFKITSDSKLGRKILEHESMEKISVIEQSLCVNGKAFVGTSYSTWTTTVWMLRTRKKYNQNLDTFLDFLGFEIE